MIPIIFNNGGTGANGTNRADEYRDPSFYTDGTYSYTGVPSKNDEFLPDVLQLPANYRGGNWTARCTAGQQDTSSRSVRYTSPSQNRPGPARLVK